MLKPQRLLLALLLALTPIAAAACGGSDESTETPSTTEASADAPTETGTTSGRYLAATAIEEGDLQIYSEPDETKKSQTLKNPRLVNDDPNAAVPLVMLVKEKQDDWYQVLLPVRPNGTTGWVKASDVETEDHDYRIEVQLSAFQLKVYAGDDEVFAAPIAVGEADTPTPGGEYYTTELLEPPNPDGDYGKYALGLSGFSDDPVIIEQFGGTGQLGIHGTNQPEKIGSRVSHGCVRLKNEDITALVEIGMPLGTPVIINA